MALYPTVDGGGIEPVAKMATLEMLLTGRGPDEVLGTRSGSHMVAERGNGELLVVKLSESLTTALASTSTEGLAAVAETWARTQEFVHGTDADGLLGFLKELAGLARRARAEQASLYCWMSV